MRYGIQTILSLALATLLCQPLQAGASTEASPSSWPEKVVVLEQLEPVTRYRFQVRGLVTKGKVTGPAIMRVHIDATGAVVRAVLHTSCGNADLDEVALHGMREMRFKPYAQGDAPMAVTLVAPIHVPARLGKSN